jgi:hypothetical protein
MKHALFGLIALLLTGNANAHPLGNNTVNRQAGLTIARTTITLHYVVDLAEIPTLLATADADENGDGNTSVDELDRYARRYCTQIGEGVDARIDGDKLNLRLLHTQWQRMPGAAGLYTLRIEADFAAPLRARSGMKIEYRDHRHAEEPGWKEVFMSAADGLALDAADVPRASQSQDLRVYPPVTGDAPNVLAASANILVLATDSASAVVGHTAASHPARPVWVPEAASQHEGAERVDARLNVGSMPAQVAPSASRVPVAPVASPGNLPVWAFFRLGIHHIATGWDHLLFLLGLILTQTSLRRLAGVVTAFTAAHSLTLGLAASGLVSLPGVWVEPAIALTIFYVGLSNLLGFSRHNIALAFAFGLIHGFGFAGALAESMGSLRAGGGAWLLDLAAFNLGIEAFQLALILTLLPLLRLSLRASWSAAAFNVASFVVMSAGLGWFFSRVY